MATLLSWCFVGRPTTSQECSAATPGIPGVPPSAFTSHVGYFADQLWSFLFIQSQLLLGSAASDSDLMACRKACPQTPILVRRLVDDVATNPLLSTSTGSTCGEGLQDCSRQHSPFSPPVHTAAIRKML